VLFRFDEFVHFGTGLLDNDLFSSYASLIPHHRAFSRATQATEHKIPDITNDANKFAVNIDTSHFAPKEIKVVYLVSINFLVDLFFISWKWNNIL